MTFRGAGSAGRCYVGAIEVLWDAGVRPDTLVGTSAGAIAAAILGVHGSPCALLDALSDPQLARIADDLHGIARVVEGPVDAWRLRFRAGKNTGAPLHEWLLKQLGDVTFGELARTTGTRVQMWAYDLEARRPARFCAATTPQLRLRCAAAASSCIPGYFVPDIIAGRRYCDGGLVHNDPLPQLAGSDRFRPEQVVGLRVSSRPVPVTEPSESFDLWDLLESVGKGLVESSEVGAWAAMPAQWKARSIAIDRCGIGALDWVLSEDRAAAAIQSGRTAAKAWLEQVEIAPKG